MPAHRPQLRATLIPISLAVLLIAGAATGCDPLASAYQRLGVRADGDSILVRYLACEDETINHVRLYQLDGDSVAMETGDELIWELSSPSNADLAAGLVPTDAAGSPLSLRPDGTYFVDVSTSRNDADSDSFSASDLSPTTFRVDRKARDPAEFERAANDSCGRS